MWLLKHPQFKAEKVHCIGFSLGAHVCGGIAKQNNLIFGRISALDPAGPGFDGKNDTRSRLDKTDALVVDVLHTSSVGVQYPIGHKDFFVNDGKNQPGCWFRQGSIISGIIDDVMDVFGCSHTRAALLYAETILNRKKCQFKACSCPSLELFNQGHCRSCKLDEIQLLGYNSIKLKRNGVFYLRTSAEPPFCFN